MLIDTVTTAQAMTADEARTHVVAVNSAAADMGRHLLELRDREGWRALGYRSWTACIENEFTYSRQYLYELMAATPVLEKLSTTVDNLSTKAALALSQFDEELQPAIVKTAQARYGKLTESNVTRVGSVIQEMAFTGHVDTGNGTSTPVDAALTTEDEEAIKRQKQYIHDHLAQREADGKPHVANNGGNNEWYTPREYIEAARTVMGAIDLDPASSDEANQCVLATHYYTAEEDGLLMPWQGSVWMNPPYAMPLVAKFSERLVAHYRAGTVKQACVLVNNATETAWFQAMAKVASAVCFPSRRVRFWEPGGALSQPLQGQAVIYLGENAALFADVFRTFGFVAVLP